VAHRVPNGIFTRSGNCLPEENWYLHIRRVLKPSKKGDRAVVANALDAKASYNVLLSCNSADRLAVHDVARRLRDEGLEPFVARRYLATGALWRSKPEDFQSPSVWTREQEPNIGRTGADHSTTNHKVKQENVARAGHRRRRFSK